MPEVWFQRLGCGINKMISFLNNWLMHLDTFGQILFWAVAIFGVMVTVYKIIVWFLEVTRVEF